VLAVTLQIFDFLVNRLALGGQFGLDFAVARLGDDTVEPAFFGTAEFAQNHFASCLELDLFCVCRLLDAALFALQEGKHGTGPLIGQRDRMKDGSDLLADRFLSHRRPVLVLARRHAFRAVEVRVALAGLGGNESTADGAAHQSTVEKRLEALALGLRAVRHHSLATVKE